MNKDKTISRRKTLDYDAEAMRFTNNEAANKYVKEAYRSGWRL